MKKFSFVFAGICAVLVAASCGSTESTTDKQPFTTDDVQAAANAKPTGEAIYKRTCAQCHMAGGDGIANAYPPLAKSDYLVDKEKTILQVIKGSSGKLVVNGKEYNNTMLPQNLNDEEIAAVLTYVYTNAIMENNGSAVTAEEVKAVRAKP